jgi:hypothetical protein
LTSVVLSVGYRRSAEPGFARREPKPRNEVGQARRRGLVGEPWVPPRGVTHSRELASAVCVVADV